MVIRVNLLIYLYTILCGCVLVFDLFYGVRKRWRTRAEPRRVERYRLALLALIDRGSPPLSDKELKQWCKKLSGISNLLSFHAAVEELLANEMECAAMEEWLQSNKDLFLKISHRYVDKSEPFYATLVAYLIWQYRLCTEKETDQFALMAQQLCLRHSLYCRENALCALYACGCAAHVVKAYILLSQREVEHSAKLVTDGLLQFTGDKNALAELLWENWESFPPYYQACFVNFIRMVSNRFGERFYALLVRGEADDEVQFAAIRYLRTHPYEKAAGLLQRYVAQWSAEDWEFAAIAALSLEQYRSTATMRALLAGCRSASWHVRENASDSLIHMLSDTMVQRLIVAEKDKYAKEMLLYKLMKRVRERAK